MQHLNKRLYGDIKDLPIVRSAFLISVLVVSFSGLYVLQHPQSDLANFDLNSVLPPSISMPPSPVPSTVFSKSDLTKFDGKNGHKCYVAVDGLVYEIQEGLLWQDGQHSTSNGLAYCGVDLSTVISQAPHGKNILSQLTIVGRY